MDFIELRRIDKDLLKRGFRMHVEEDDSFYLKRGAKRYSPVFTSNVEYTEWLENEYNEVLRRL